MSRPVFDANMKILVVVYDDTTVFMAEAFLRECEMRGLRPTLALVQGTDKVLFQVDPGVFQERKVLRSHVSERQVAHLRARARDFVVIGDAELGRAAALYDVVLTCKLPPRASESLLQLVRSPGSGPVLVSFSSGLDASPWHTLMNRAYADILQANSPMHFERLIAAAPPLWTPPRLGVGHPFFAVRKPIVWRRWDEVRTVYFLHQSIWPSNPVTRREVYRFVHDLAVSHPDKQIKLKLRHLPDENRDNVNKEKYPPSEYFGKYGEEMPANLSWDARPFGQTLDSADLYLSLSSSGIVEGLVNGVMGCFVEGFPGEEQDVDSRRIIGDFRGSGLVVDRTELLAGRLPQADHTELERQLAPADYFDELLSTCQELLKSKALRRTVGRPPFVIRMRKGAGRVARRLRSLLVEE
jgi:hypothetical protein